MNKNPTRAEVLQAKKIVLEAHRLFMRTCSEHDRDATIPIEGMPLVFTGEDLSGAVFEGSKMDDCDFRRCSFKKSTFQESDFDQAIFNKSKMQNIRARGAILPPGFSKPGSGRGR